MASAKRAQTKPIPAAEPKPIPVSPAVDPAVGTVQVNVFDGTRQFIKQGTQVLLTVRDGAQNQLFRDYVTGPSITLKLPVHDNFSDNYSIVASAEGYEQAGFQPVAIGPNAPQTLNLMLLANDASYHFAQARWSDLVAQRPKLSRLFNDSLNGADAATAYGQMMENGAEKLACLLNITAAMQQISLPQGSPLDYFKSFDVPALKSDRIFGYADPALVAQVKLAAQQGEFATEPAIDLSLHTDATSSFKQIQFGEANVQLTFHENNKKIIDGVECIYVEPDIDYYKDTAAHLLLEVIPNGLTGNLSSPRVVYVLRWIAGQHAGVPNFDPLFTIE